MEYCVCSKSLKAYCYSNMLPFIDSLIVSVQWQIHHDALTWEAKFWCVVTLPRSVRYKLYMLCMSLWLLSRLGWCAAQTYDQLPWPWHSRQGQSVLCSAHQPLINQGKLHIHIQWMVSHVNWCCLTSLGFISIFREYLRIFQNKVYEW